MVASIVSSCVLFVTSSGKEPSTHPFRTHLPFQTPFQSLASPKDEQLDGPFASPEFVSDLCQTSPLTVVLAQRIPRAVAQSFEAFGKMVYCLFIPTGRRRHQLFQFETKLCPGGFFLPPDLTSTLAEQVSGNAQKPWTDHLAGIEPGPGNIKPQKDLLGEVVGVVRLEQAGSQEGMDRLLVIGDDLFEHGAVDRPGEQGRPIWYLLRLRRTRGEVSRHERIRGEAGCGATENHPARNVESTFSTNIP